MKQKVYQMTEVEYLHLANQATSKRIKATIWEEGKYQASPASSAYDCGDCGDYVIMQMFDSKNNHSNYLLIDTSVQGYPFVTVMREV